jgi:hypothetical protein
MALPFTFAAQTAPQMSELDDNFAALGAMTAIPCSATGTNALVLTPNADTPIVSAYTDYMPFSCVVAAPNTGAATAAVGALAALPVYADTIAGPVALVGGEIVAGNLLILTYDSALAGGGGGFHIVQSEVNPVVTAVARGVLLNAGTVSINNAVTLEGTAAGTLSINPGSGTTDVIVNMPSAGGTVTLTYAGAYSYQPTRLHIHQGATAGVVVLNSGTVAGFVFGSEPTSYTVTPIANATDDLDILGVTTAYARVERANWEFTA